MRLVLFDCDGTLVDSAGFIHDCMRLCFRDRGYAEPSLEQTKSIIGLTLDVAIAQLLGRPVDAEITAMTAGYKANFRMLRAEADFQEALFDGIAPVVETLGQRDDVILGVVTGKSRRGLAAVLERHGFERTFFTLRTADDCPSKPHPAMVQECCREAGIAPAQTLVVGDAIYDMQMAQSAGARGIGVSWGYSTPAALMSAGAHVVIDHPSALMAHLEEGADAAR